ncbi:YihY/virulence factor BrkB family protein [Erysipelothrix aquatica]|uniref:YihY/virulence factor BrkB family protein n=1 Tax=Erysipelothrix aquatica TaxID=2683714 RepID=UPI0013578CB6|nr:YhjD/YihY/BrkB family envelope integrity protein [Erysipelothrix aquatica]
MKKYRKNLKALFTMMSSNEGTLFTYAFAYSLIVGIAPILILSVVFIGKYVVPVEQLISFLQRYIPKDLIEPFVLYISASNFDNLGLLITLFAASVWVGSKSIYSFLILSSEQDQVSVNGWLLRGLSVTYFLLILVGVASVGLIMGFFDFSYKLFVIPLVIGFFMVFYRLMSFRYTKWREVLPGAIIAALILLLLGQLFFVYINRFTNYQTIYGPLASIMILLISGWFIAWIIFFGYSINYVFRDNESELPEKNRFIRFLTKF